MDSTGNSAECRAFLKQLYCLERGTLRDSGCLPPLVFLHEAAHLLCSFFAVLTILVHFSFTWATVRKQKPREFTLLVMSSLTFVLFLLERTLENLPFITSRFFSAASNITVHSAGAKVGFCALFAQHFPPCWRTQVAISRNPRITMATGWIATYSADSYSRV